MFDVDEHLDTIRKTKSSKMYTKHVWYFRYGQRRCHNCGVQLVWGKDNFKNQATFDHMVTRCCGGSYGFKNGLVVCYSCNHRRRNINFYDFVIKNDLPKKEWLLKKYVEALEHLQRTKPDIWNRKDNKRIREDFELLTRTVA